MSTDCPVSIFIPQGNAHIVYNGYFYYFRRDEPKIVKYDLTFDKQAGRFSLLAPCGYRRRICL